MKINNFDIIAPGLATSLGLSHLAASNEVWSEAEVLGSVVWLWLHSPDHREMPLHMLSALLLPAIKYQQFILASLHGKPVFYLSWANLNEESETRYIQKPAYAMPEQDWNSGDRLWILDWVAPFGHSYAISRLLWRHLFSDRCGRALYHRGDERGLRIKTFRGIAVLQQAAQQWFANRPVIRP